MALPPELRAIKANLDQTGYAKRTPQQDRLLAELVKLDGMIMQKSLEEAAFSSDTRMTSPGGGSCGCCGR